MALPLGRHRRGVPRANTSALLSSGPEDVHWLTPQEKANLLDAIFREESDAPSAARVRVGFNSLLRIACIPAATYFLLMSGLYTLSFWIPRILQGTGMSLVQIGWITSLIYAVGGTALIILSRFADSS